MTSELLPHGVYRIAQNRFDAIPGSPWFYRVSENIRGLFDALPLLGSIAVPRQGLTTADNARFIRYGWEVSLDQIGFACADRDQALKLQKKWYPLIKGGQAKLWFGGELSVGNWESDGREIKSYIVERYPYLNGKWEWVAKNAGYYFREGAAYSAVAGGRLSFRWMPQGHICEHASNAIYLDDLAYNPRGLVGLFNSSLANFIVGLNETINVNIEDILRMPIYSPNKAQDLDESVGRCIYLREYEDSLHEKFWTFISPLQWNGGLDRLTGIHTLLERIHQQINKKVYILYGISDQDRATTEAELVGDYLAIDGMEDEPLPEVEEETEEPEPPVSQEELAVQLISYAGGVVFRRFEPGMAGKLGSSIYEREIFAKGSLTAPDETDFDELVGPPERFAYVDEEGGRHVFPQETEKSLRVLAVLDGITVLDEGHQRDLPALVEQVLLLMLGEQDAREVIEIGANGDLRKFLSKEFFTKHHFKMYRKRPVYWPIQSAKRAYGFVLFHEKIEKDTFYRLQRDFLDPKRKHVELELADIQGRLEGAQGKARKTIEKQMAELQDLAEELAQFAKDLEEITSGGYEPEPNWIDDGVILRMTPLWKVIPIWKSEPKKYWERLEKGEYDWSRIAMRYWPERVREKCKTNKSFAIAHVLEHLYEGD